MTPNRSLIAIITLAIVVLLLAAFLLLNVDVYRDEAFVCENTGSRRGHGEWFLGTRTRHWYERSKLEEFMQIHYPEVLAHRWTSYAGTGKSLLGMPIFYGHGRPGPIPGLRLDLLNRCVDLLTDHKVRGLYDVFSSEDRDRIEATVTHVQKQMLAGPAETAPLDSAGPQ